MRRLVLVLVLALPVGGCAAPGASLEDGPGLSGTYVVNGVDPIGTEYSGTVVIEATEEPGRYRIEWLVTGGIQEGEGTLEGETLSVVWQTVSGPLGRSSGTAQYTVGSDGRLSGTRTVDGAAGAGTEEIFPEP